MVINSTTQPLGQAASVLTVEGVITCLQRNLEELRAFNIQSFALFGSVARGEGTAESDLDFIVELEGPATFRGYMGLKSFLEDLFVCSIDLVIKKDIKPQIRQTILEGAIRVT